MPSVSLDLAFRQIGQSSSRRLSAPLTMATKPKAEPTHAARVERILDDAGAEHVRARRYGATVIAESGPDGDPVRHFRLRRDNHRFA